MHEEISIPELTAAVARLSALLGRREGGVEPLEGGITNHNFRVNFGGTDYVVRLPGKDTNLLRIDRQAELMATRRASDLRVAPKVAAALDDPPCLVTCFLSGRNMVPDELRAPEAVATVARALRGFHESGVELPADFQVYDIAGDYGRLARERGDEPPADFEDSLACAGEVVGAVRDHPEHRPVPCHNDLLAANFLLVGDDIVIVDWEYAGMGDRFFDLGNFAVNNELAEPDEERLLEAYFGEPPGARRRSALKLFRFMSDFREAMWGVLQASVSELDFDFNAYAAKHLARLAETRTDPRFRTWLEEASG
jgi:thiamine kinase-like enzyme